MNISIGLDKYKLIVYIVNMKLNIKLTQLNQANIFYKRQFDARKYQLPKREEASIDFANKQFQNLTKKNIQIPIKLYNL